MIKKWMGFLAICLLLLSILNAGWATEAKELVPNGGFEDFTAAGNPVAWFVSMYRGQEGYSRITVTDERAHSGQYSALVENANVNDARFVCSLQVEPESLYRFSGYVLVESMQDGGNGANLSVEDLYAFSERLFDTHGEWKYVEWYGETGPGQREVSIGVRVGGYGAESVGKAYFDDVSVVKVNALPEEVVAELWYRTEAPAKVETPASARTPEKSTALFVALALIFLLVTAFCQKYLAGLGERELNAKNAKEKGWLCVFWLLMLAALAARVLLARSVEGYQVDIGCFTAWSLRMADVGPVHFYAEGYFCDYPPGYMLMLWPVGLLMNALGLVAQPDRLLLLKSISILCDMAVALFVFTFAKKRLSTKAAICLALLFAVNPAALVNGAAWGQVDTLLALMMLLTAHYAMKNQWKAAIPLFVLGALIKPQALLLAPVGVVWAAAALLRAPKRSSKVRDMVQGFVLGACVTVLVILPFAVKQSNPIIWLIGLYSDTLSSYGFATLNTANLYYLLGANWQALATEPVWLLPFNTGLIMLLFGLWRTRLYEGLGLGKETISRMRREWREGKGISIQTSQYLLSALCAITGLVFLALAFLGCTYQSFGIVMMVFVFAWALTGSLVDADQRKLPFYMALALVGVYVLGIKVHERYLFIALPLLLMGYAATRDRRLVWLCAGFSATTFINTAIVLDNSILFGSGQGHLNTDTMGLNIVLCVLNLALCGYAGHISFTGVRADKPQEKMEATPDAEKGHCFRQALLSPKDARLRLGSRDWLIMTTVTVLYAGMAFMNLGSTVAPQNGWISTASDEQIVFELESDKPYYLLYYAGVSYDSFSVSTSPDGENWTATYPCEMRQGLCYRWKYAIHLQDGSSGEFLDDSPQNRVLLEGRFLRLNAEKPGLNLFELLARDEEGARILMKVVSHTGAREGLISEAKGPGNLLDEQDTLQGEPGWFNGMYFDEIYHGRTAYEHLHGQAPYETTHPPLGKLLMSAAIAVFGMTPFGWRFAGTLIGVLMLPALYLLAKQLFKRRDLAAFAMILMAFDLMHFAQTRIATIDSFPVFFIILSYLCMGRYLMTDVFAVALGEPLRLWSRAFKRSLIPLAMCGLFMGLSIASKWIGLYSAVGLALLFFAAIYRQFRVSNVSFAYPAWEGGAEAQSEEDKAQGLRVLGAQKYTLHRIMITCGLCVVFFLLVPAIIYFLSYIPYLSPTGPVTLERVIAAQKGMLEYHSTPGLGMDHPFQSPWWQWPLILKPIWFAQDKFEPVSMASTIMSMGNPLVFYGGACCMLALIIAYLCKYFAPRSRLGLRGEDGDMTLTVLVVGFLAQYLPWVLVPRSMYIYHYFASVPFIILATTWAMSCLPQSRPRLRQGVMWGYAALCVVFFELFYPYASGMLTSMGWLDAMKWFSRLYY